MPEQTSDTSNEITGTDTDVVVQSGTTGDVTVHNVHHENGDGTTYVTGDVHGSISHTFNRG
ncbi:hypothetical protein [Streptomyces sp. NPDC017941]|uniref:hypothetical protein n=1 Tax=Streptomyces sp. NPDC017941 TaxID=3365018 RepID=UPI0037B366CC